MNNIEWEIGGNSLIYNSRNVPVGLVNKPKFVLK